MKTFHILTSPTLNREKDKRSMQRNEIQTSIRKEKKSLTGFNGSCPRDNRPEKKENTRLMGKANVPRVASMFFENPRSVNFKEVIESAETNPIFANSNTIQSFHISIQGMDTSKNPNSRTPISLRIQQSSNTNWRIGHSQETLREIVHKTLTNQILNLSSENVEKY